MKSSKLIEIFKNGNMVIPIYLLKHYKKFNINMSINAFKDFVKRKCPSEVVMTGGYYGWRHTKIYYMDDVIRVLRYNGVFVK